ncbi:hypothetical protein BH792_gp132 [Staphylococcus phage Stau2]|uniref:Uncharacterized protein n=3 Tax=Silviavirus TaxID=1857889 RepID=A0A0U1ZUH5_9CAUD|nr:hypothetical protein O151_gp062 [Staphylococcus phage vB_SauM_Remus]YP_009275888.1 hypothetical protein BH792_gp132 [Staphylococcus phage Stau2]QVD58442.1 hypothetical protein PM93_015 [Staphylococcus phage PM93]QVD58645.1 hypothetical protein Remus_014 [Silviavirus remus]UXE02864.1 hypothetical protein Koombakaat1_00074 [Staphylococcus phage Koomba-kaat_1]AFV81007.1 hypothetical protein Remus_128 [Staphylococcus phage vB_SauM_Remus]AKA61382.1 hypothetical protein Stau2_131 [Staphylococcus
MDIMVSELFEYILGHNTHILGNWHTYYLDKGYCIKVNDDKHYNNMKFIKNGRVVKEVINSDTLLPKGFSSIYSLIDYYEEALDEKCRKEKERLKEIRTFLGK